MTFRMAPMMIKSRRRRRGATLLEAAVVLAVCLVMLLGMVDLSIAILRSTVISEAARRITRSAIVHGSSASEIQDTWGPAAIHTTASSNTPVALAIRSLLTTIDPADVTITVVWPDGDNQVDQRVNATVTYRHDAIVGIPGWYNYLDLSASSTMRIAH